MVEPSQVQCALLEEGIGLATLGGLSSCLSEAPVPSTGEAAMASPPTTRMTLSSCHRIWPASTHHRPSSCLGQWKANLVIDSDQIVHGTPWRRGHSCTGCANGPSSRTSSQPRSLHTKRSPPCTQCRALDRGRPTRMLKSASRQTSTCGPRDQQ